jgi:uncharacterized protein (TIGR03663 family)
MSMAKSSVALALMAILTAALAFRMAKLAERPMHADEAILADKFGTFLESSSYRYDPQDYHGPALVWLTFLPARVMGAHRYADLTETSLRLVPALCGVLLVLMPLLLSDGLGRWSAVTAAALTAISPAMVYYSRYYIPEMLLTTLASAAIVCGYHYARSGQGAWVILAGMCAGLMFIAKETAVIVGGSMLISLALTIRRKPAMSWVIAAGIALAVAIPVVTIGSADGWRAAMTYWHRAIDTPVHRHPWNYYLALLIRSESSIVVLAVCGLAAAVARKAPVSTDGRLLSFLAWYACVMTLAYSLIPYKTPWCVLGLLHALILLAGVGAMVVLESLRRHARVAVAFLLTACAAQLGWQAWRISFPLSSDLRNPYAYAHTGRDVFTIRDSVEKLALGSPKGRGMPLQVLGAQNLWPLPWYFRTFAHVEWRRRLGPGFQPGDAILVTPDMEPALIHEIYEVPPPGKRELYRSIFDRRVELRPGLELRGYVRASVAELSER